jgi:hypothetical protein
MSGFASTVIDAADEDAALEWLHSQRRTDGLPVVVPTPARVRASLAACGRDPAASFGRIGPAMADATVEKVVINAVMAGCRPEHLPVVFAAVRAVCDPRLDMTEVQSTTHCIAPMVIVNGPAAKAAGLASSFGVLGYGHRANLSIGRALRLCLINIGGGWPEVSDLALHGHPGAIAYCIAENEDVSPFPPLHTSLGFEPGTSAVTVVNVEAPHSVLVLPEAGDPTAANRLLTAIARSLSSLGSNNTLSGNGAMVVVLNPDHAAALAAAGHDRESVQRELSARSGARVADHRAIAPPARLPLFDGKADDERIPSIREPSQVLVTVAGGTGLYSMVMPSWGAGPHHNRALTVTID